MNFGVHLSNRSKDFIEKSYGSMLPWQILFLAYFAFQGIAVDRWSRSIDFIWKIGPEHFEVILVEHIQRKLYSEWLQVFDNFDFGTELQRTWQIDIISNSPHQFK